MLESHMRLSHYTSKLRYLLKPKSKKVAVFIVNYNMPERANALYEYLMNNVKYPIDIYLVDNGSDITKPSQYTNVWIKKNKQTMGGWLEAFKEADRKPYRYYAYSFLFTSMMFTDKSGDYITSMIQKLKEDKDAVVVIPSISKDSDIYWEHLKNRGTNDFRRTWFIDNIAPLWKADWLDRNGRVNPDLTYAYGVDIEMCYKARRANKSIWIDEKIEVSKTTDIGYKMNRMNMSAEDRRKNAWDNMEQVFRKKYGENWYDMLYNRYIKDEWR